MKKIVLHLASFSILFSLTLSAFAQQDDCKVLTSEINGSYKGDCKKGLANGVGVATGLYRYEGNFKNGKPNGYGTIYYNDTANYAGYFLDGLKEGKGEMHYLKKGSADSVLKGYWSGNEFRGSQYITYTFNGASLFDKYEIKPTPESGRTITFEISTTSGSPAGFPNDFNGDPGYVLKMDDVTVGNGVVIRELSRVVNAKKSFVTYDIESFPVILYAHLSNGDSFRLDLFKSAKWYVRLYVNK